MRIFTIVFVIIICSCSQLDENIEYLDNGRYKRIKYLDDCFETSSYLIDNTTGDTLQELQFFRSGGYRKISHQMLDGEGDYDYREAIIINDHHHFKYFDSIGTLREYYFTTDNPKISVKLKYDKDRNLIEFEELIKQDTINPFSNTKIVLFKDGKIDYNESKLIPLYKYEVKGKYDSAGVRLDFTVLSEMNYKMYLAKIEDGYPWDLDKHRDVYEINGSTDTITVHYSDTNKNYLRGGFITSQNQGDRFTDRNVVFFPIFYSIPDSVIIPDNIKNILNQRYFDTSFY